jgi:hypothetical protein
MVAVPNATPVTSPVEEPTEAIPEALLLQLPPGVASASAVAAPMQAMFSPVIDAGKVVTVTIVNALHPATV